MTINHLNLIVTNVPETTEFFRTNFDFNIESIIGNHAVTILTNKANFTLVLMSQKDEPEYPRNFHLGFFLDTPQEVDTIHNRLTGNGIRLENKPEMIRDTYGFYFHFDKLLIEVAHRTRPNTVPL